MRLRAAWVLQFFSEAPFNDPEVPAVAVQSKPKKKNQF